jgi:hypothetical protein
MFRETTAVLPLDYTGTCSVTVTEVSPTIRGTVTCGQMIKSYSLGSPLNPVVNTTTLNLSADFYCTFGETTLTKMDPESEQNPDEFTESENPDEQLE